MKDIRVENTDDLLSEVGRLRGDGARLITITGVDLGESIEVIYHFDLEGVINVRAVFDHGDRLPSVSEVFFYARLYERELAEMFDVEIEGIHRGLLLSEDMRGKGPLRKSFKVENVTLVSKEGEQCPR